MQYNKIQQQCYQIIQSNQLPGKNILEQKVTFGSCKGATLLWVLIALFHKNKYDYCPVIEGGREFLVAQIRLNPVPVLKLLTTCTLLNKPNDTNLNQYKNVLYWLFTDRAIFENMANFFPEYTLNLLLSNTVDRQMLFDVFFTETNAAIRINKCAIFIRKATALLFRLLCVIQTRKVNFNIPSIKLFWDAICREIVKNPSRVFECNPSELIQLVQKINNTPNYIIKVCIFAHFFKIRVPIQMPIPIQKPGADRSIVEIPYAPSHVNTFTLINGQIKELYREVDKCIKLVWVQYDWDEYNEPDIQFYILKQLIISMHPNLSFIDNEFLSRIVIQRLIPLMPEEHNYRLAGLARLCVLYFRLSHSGDRPSDVPRDINIASFPFQMNFYKQTMKCFHKMVCDCLQQILSQKGIRPTNLTKTLRELIIINISKTPCMEPFYIKNAITSAIDDYNSPVDDCGITNIPIKRRCPD